MQEGRVLPQDSWSGRARLEDSDRGLADEQPLSLLHSRMSIESLEVLINLRTTVGGELTGGSV